MKCDCDSDCDDGSDETDAYASCSAIQIATCNAMQSGAEGKFRCFRIILQQ